MDYLWIFIVITGVPAIAIFWFVFPNRMVEKLPEKTHTALIIAMIVFGALCVVGLVIKLALLGVSKLI